MAHLELLSACQAAESTTISCAFCIRQLDVLAACGRATLLAGANMHQVLLSKMFQGSALLQLQFFTTQRTTQLTLGMLSAGITTEVVVNARIYQRLLDIYYPACKHEARAY